MKRWTAQFSKELFGLFVSPTVFLLLGFWFFLNGLLFIYLLEYSPAVRSDLSLLPQFLFGSGLLVWLLLPAFPPLLTLRLLAEEHKLGTLEPLLTSPLGDAEAVLAKFGAASLFFLVFWGGVLALFLMLSLYGATLEWSSIGGGFLGALLVSWLFLATGLFASSWTGNSLLATGGGAAINYVLLFLPAMLEPAPGWLGTLAKECSIPNMLDRGFASGMIDSWALAYLLGLALLFLFLTWIRLVSRRWVP